jgi:hypothetical protein
MEIDKIKMPKDIAKVEHKRYSELIKKRNDKFLKDMQKATFQLSKGRELIDIYKVMEKVGLNKEFQPKLAIAKATWKNVNFIKKDSGRGFFSNNAETWYSASNGDVDLPPHTFGEWARAKKDLKTTENIYQIDDRWELANPKMITKVPLIPSNLMPEGSLDNYYILWEVEVWENLPPKKDDPILLKRITENLFVILGAWDVTDLEQSIINGLK